MRIPPCRALLALAFCSLLVAAAAFADVPNRPRAALNDAIAPHGTGAGRGWCTIVYYNLCSGWLWTYSGFESGDEAGVAFDMPTEWVPSFSNSAFWWYWRYTIPGWGFTITYRMWNLDANLCKVGATGGIHAGQDPTERWNHYSGLGYALTPRVGITAMFDEGRLPRFCTDNNNKSYSAPNACPGWSVGPIHTLYWGGLHTQYCPPQYFADNYGAVDCLMDASFEGSGDATDRPSSWSSVKSLFR